MATNIAFLCVLLLSSISACAGPSTRASEVYGERRLLESLRTGDHIVVGAIGDVLPIDDGRKFVHTGRVTIDVREWFSGSGRQQLTLPYVYTREGVPIRMSLPFDWPPVEKLPKGQLLLCVYKPGGRDWIAAPVEGSDGAASFVWAVTGAGDPNIAAIKTIIAMDAERTAAGWSERLAKGLNGDQPLVRQYCVAAVTRDLGAGDPAQAASLLERHLSRARTLAIGPIESQSTTTAILLLAAASKSRQVVGSAIKQFAQTAGSADETEWIRSRAMQSLAELVTRPDAPKAADALDAPLRMRLRAYLENSETQIRFREGQEAALLAWLTDPQ